MGLELLGPNEQNNMLSLQRGLERYQMIYSWKVIENLVPNCGLEQVIDSEQSR